MSKGAIRVNEVLRRAMYDAGFTELDLSVELAVDPKTVRNWMRGQLPHQGRRAALAKLLGIDEDIAWPALRSAKRLFDRPSDLAGVFPRADLLKPQDWLALFGGAQAEVDVVTMVPPVVLDDPRIIQLLERQALKGVRIRLVFVSPDGLDSTMAGDGGGSPSDLLAAIRMVEPLRRLDHFELRVHRDVVYSSLYRADGQFLVNQHAHGMSSAQSPLFHYRRTEDNEIFDVYLASLEVIWSAASLVPCGWPSDTR